MKLKNVKIGMRVQVKSKGAEVLTWYENSLGKSGEVVGTDTNDNYTVHVQFDDGSGEWGSHKGLRKVKGGDE